MLQIAVRLLVVLFAAALMPAAVTRILVEERTDVLAGRAFGTAGPYERIVGKAHFAVDPKLPANRIITDIDLAPRNEAGLVEFSSDIHVLKPRDSAKGNGTVLFEVSNRGRKGMIGMFHRGGASVADPVSAEDFGDVFLLEQGFTLVWLGWQFDVPEQAGLMHLYAPVVKGITGLVRSNFVLDKKARSASLGDRTHPGYPVIDREDPSIQLTIRDRNTGPARTIPRNQWQFAREEGGKAVPDAKHVYMEAGFEPGKIYEVVYPSKDPAVVGLGQAAVRDLISFFKYAGVETKLADQRRYIKRSLGFGTSQSGRFLRTFLYYGFNRDEKDRKVFDGVWSHVAGAGRGSFNHRFAQPSRDGHPFLNFFYPTDIFPYTNAAQMDPETGITDGLLTRAEKDKTVPKIFYTNGSYEYYGRAASLIHTSVDGKKDVDPGADSRIYLLAGTQHGAGKHPPARSGTENLANPNDYRWAMRGLLAAMQQWLAEGKEPPASQYPQIQSDKLVTPGAVQFPKIPGTHFPARLQNGYRVDYGPEFRTAGIVSKEPPVVGKPFPAMAPQVDRDGNETAGIRLPEVQAPLGTYTGWNFRVASAGAPGELYNMVGSYFPFARTKAEREKNGDPRPSIEERYKNRADYVDQVTAAAKALAASGYVLAADVPLIVKQSEAQWDDRMK